MPKIVATHAVVDIERCLSGKAERAAANELRSGSKMTDFVAEDASNKIAVTADVAEIDALKPSMASRPPELAALMEKARCGPPDDALHRGVASRLSARNSLREGRRRQLGRLRHGTLLLNLRVPRSPGYWLTNVQLSAPNRKAATRFTDDLVRHLPSYRSVATAA